jgi:hypothetical protein
MNEIQISAVTGLSPLVQLYSGSSAVGSPFSATEIGSTGEYVASMPSVPYGRYLVLATVGNLKLGSGEIMWDGAYEILEGISIIQGLNPNAPSNTNINTKKWTAGAIIIDMSGDLLTDTTMTRKI